MDNPWGIVSLSDVYVGFFFFIGWIAYRESCRESFWLGLLPSAWAEMWLPVFMRLSLCLKAGVMLLFSFWEKRTKFRMNEQNRDRKKKRNDRYSILPKITKYRTWRKRHDLFHIYRKGSQLILIFSLL